MSTSSHSTPNTRSSGDMEKELQEKDDLETASDHLQLDNTRPVRLEEQPTQQFSPTSWNAGINATDWNGPDDPDNPHNWPKWKRYYHAAVPALFGLAVTSGTSTYSPAISQIMVDFSVTKTVAILGLTTYTLGLAIGPILTAPLSEGHGRRIVYFVTAPIFMLFILGAGFSKSYASLCVCRLFAGLAGSPVLAVGGGSNADVFRPHERAVAMSLFLFSPFAGPVLGPIIGGFVSQYKSWRWTQWCQLFIAVAVSILGLPMKETFKPIILKKRAKVYGLTVADDKSLSQVKTAIALKVIRPLHMLVSEPPVMFFSLYTAFVFGVLFMFFAAFPYIFQRGPYNFTTSQYGLTFVSIGIGITLAVATSIINDRIFYQKQYRKAVAAGTGQVAPEHRLYSAMMGSFGIVIGLFWFGWTAGTGQHWAFALVGAIPFAWGNLCVFISTCLYLADVYGPMNGASAMAANGVIRYTFGAVFPLFTVQMYQGMGISWATSLLGFLAVLLLPVPWVFFKWGPSIRVNSKFACMG